MLKIYKIFPLMALTFVFTTGATTIDRETKAGVLRAHKRIDRLSEQERLHHQEVMQLLKEISSNKTLTPTLSPSQKIIRVELPQMEKVEKPSKIEPAPVAPVQQPTASAVIASTSTTTPQPEAPHEDAEIKMLLTQVRQIRGQAQSAQDSALIAIFISLASLTVLIGLFITIRRNEKRIRKVVWKSEVDSLRNEVMGSHISKPSKVERPFEAKTEKIDPNLELANRRPQLKVEKSYDHLILANIGPIAADDIKLFIGPAPATMKQKVTIPSRIPAGDKCMVDVATQSSNGQIYGSMEYRNPQNNRTYKDQFILRIDRVTGELFPIQQAS